MTDNSATAGGWPGAPFLAFFARSGAFRWLCAEFEVVCPAFLARASGDLRAKLFVTPHGLHCYNAAPSALQAIRDCVPCSARSSCLEAKKAPLLAKNARNGAPMHPRLILMGSRTSASAPPNFLLPPRPVVDPNQSRFSECVGAVATLVTDGHWLGLS